MIQSYRELNVWKNAMNLTKEVYLHTRTFPMEEKFGLASQMNRAVVSIPSNIAEGHGRRSTGSYVHHLGIARGSLCELETQIEISHMLGFIAEKDVDLLTEKCTIINKQLAALIKSLNSR